VEPLGRAGEMEMKYARQVPTMPPPTMTMFMGVAGGVAGAAFEAGVADGLTGLAGLAIVWWADGRGMGGRGVGARGRGVPGLGDCWDAGEM
jgi:hypothetical protein